MPRAIVVDWGTTAFRAWLVDMDYGGRVLDEIGQGKGLRDLAQTDFPAYCQERLAPWLETEVPSPPVYMVGMVGSTQGWQTAPQPSLPLDLDAIAAGIVAAEGMERAWILPGCRRVDAEGVPDVMRGEETQIMGAMALAERPSATFCLPGSHSKWAWTEDGVLVDFTTSMTGEAYAALLRHTLLSRTANAEAPWQEQAFRLGLQQSHRSGGLLHHIFTARSRLLVEDIGSDETPSYLSGVLIGHEVSAMAARIENPNWPVVLVCATALHRPYEVALNYQGLRSVWIESSSATLAGIHAIVRRNID